MKLKKILATVAASAIALSSVAITSFAEAEGKTLTGNITFAEKSWDPGSGEVDSTIVTMNQSNYNFSPTDTLEATVTAEGDIDTTEWMVAFNSSASWAGVNSAQGTLTFNTTIQDLMDANSITDVEKIGDVSLQIWTPKIDDTVSYELKINGGDATEPVVPALDPVEITGDKISYSFNDEWKTGNFEAAVLDVASIADISTFDSITFTVEIDEAIAAEAIAGEQWIGGSFAINSDETGWKSLGEVCFQESANKDFTFKKVSDGIYEATYKAKAPIFTDASNTYVTVSYQENDVVEADGPFAKLTKVTLFDSNANPVDPVDPPVEGFKTTFDEVTVRFTVENLPAGQSVDVALTTATAPDAETALGWGSTEVTGEAVNISADGTYEISTTNAANPYLFNCFIKDILGDEATADLGGAKITITNIIINGADFGPTLLGASTQEDVQNISAGNTVDIAICHQWMDLADGDVIAETEVEGVKYVLKYDDASKSGIIAKATDGPIDDSSEEPVDSTDPTDSTDPGDDTKVPTTGITFAFAGLSLAGAAVVAAKKRK